MAYLGFKLQNEDELVLNPSVDSSQTYDNVSTPSPLVKGRYAKKKAHWNFIDRDDKKKAAEGNCLKTDESLSVHDSDFIDSDDSSEIL